MILLDVNVLLYAVDRDAAEHERARRWLERALLGEERIAAPWTVILGFIRISTNPRIFTRPWSVERATTAVNAWLGAGLAIADATPDHWPNLVAALRDGRAASAHVMDAYLAALAIASGARLATFDRGFARFPGLRIEDVQGEP